METAMRPLAPLLVLAGVAMPAVALAGLPSLPDAFSVRPKTLEVALLNPVQDEAPPDAGDAPATTMAVQEADPGRKFDMELGFRGRYMTVPDAVIDVWFYNADDAGWIYSEDRPQVHAYTVGLEFAIKSKVREDSNGGNNGIFYFQWIDNLMKEGYFDDVEDPPDHDDGDFLVPSSDLGLVALGADYAYELHMVKTMNTNGNFGMSMLVGAGLGVGILIGELEYWRPEGGVPSFTRKELGEPSAGAKRMPPVFPLVDINVGLRFNFGDRFVVRLEGGFQDMIYGGGAIGLMF
jgi:hypothetical protein